MKKTISLLILYVICASCIETGDDVEVGVVFKALNSDFWRDMERGVREVAAEHQGLRLVLLAPDAETNVAQQVDMVESMIIQRVDALLIAPCGSVELISAFERAERAGIPVIILDTDTEWEGKKCFVGSDNAQGGELAARYIVERLGGKGEVAIITGAMGHETHMDRLNGALEVFSSAEGIEVVAVQSANSDRALGMQTMENILTANPGLDAVFCTNDEMALGALEALRNLGKEDTILVGFDAIPEAVESIESGSGLDATVSQSPYEMGRKGIETAVKVIDGEAVPQVINTEIRLISRETLKA